MIEKEKKSERLNMVLSPSEIEAIDKWRFENKIGSRSEAIRKLIEIALVQDLDSATSSSRFSTFKNAREELQNITNKKEFFSYLNKKMIEFDKRIELFGYELDHVSKFIDSVKKLEEKKGEE